MASYDDYTSDSYGSYAASSFDDVSSLLTSDPSRPRLLFMGPRRGGKCWGAGTSLMLYSGRTVGVENIRAGDLLMGDDSTARAVLPGSVITGTGRMFRVESHTDGYTWTCNEHHILVLANNDKPWAKKKRGYYRIFQFITVPGAAPNSFVLSVRTLPALYDTQVEADAVVQQMRANYRPLVWECAVSDYMNFGYKDRMMMFQPNLVTFPLVGESLRSRLSRLWQRTITDAEAEETAWTIAVWLTDGGANTTNVYQIITDANRPHYSHTAIVTRLENWYTTMNGPRNEPISVPHSVSSAGNIVYAIHLADTQPGGTMSRFRRLLEDYGIFSSKVVPHSLLTESREIRTALLAGIIDGDGHFNADSKKYEVAAKSRAFMDSLVHLCRGLGYSVGMVTPRMITTDGVTYRSFRINITGYDLSDLATQITLAYKHCSPNAEMTRDQRCSGFTVTEIDAGRYYGFQLDGNGRCLLSNFLVTHNVRTHIDTQFI